MAYVHYKLAPAEKGELEKYIKFLAIKTTQVICQARQGDKHESKCVADVNGRNYWFNISIHDQPDILAATKHALESAAGEKNHLPNFPLNVEITLKTEEGYDMLLEVWTLTIAPESNSPAIRASHHVYNSFGILLKSVICVSRATPAYKLSRRQKTESYNIDHTISAGKPLDLNRLGEEHKSRRIGQVVTAFGTINMSVAYRTKMTISPTQTARDNTIMVKSDHFLNDVSPKHPRYFNAKKSDNKVIDLDKPLTPGAFCDVSKIKQYTEEDYILPETPPFSWLMKKTKKPAEETVQGHATAKATTTGTTTITTATNNNNAAQRLEDAIKISANNSAASSPTSPVSMIFSGRNSRFAMKDDEPMLKELYFPFATDTTPVSELAKFYRDCASAPMLNQDPVDLAATAADDDGIGMDESDGSIDDLTKQLEKFETSLGAYEDLVTSLCCHSDEVDSNSNS